MVINRDNLNFILINVPQSGATYIEEIYNYNTPSIIRNHTTIKDARYRTISDYSRYYSLNEYFTFSFIRNPYERIVAFYEHFNTIDEGPVNQHSFEFFIEKNLNKGIYALYLRPQLNFVLGKNKNNEILKADYIGRYEYIHRDWEYIKEKLSISEDLKIPDLIDSYPNYREYYTPKLKKIIEEYYLQDLKTFNYTF
jgi:hypothetical protein